MKLDAVPENILERIALWAGLAPKPVAQVMWSIAMTRAMIVAAELQLFENMGTNAWTAQAIAEKLSCDPVGMDALLAALNGFGFLSRSNSQYMLTKDSQKWFLSSSSKNVKAAIEFAIVLEKMLQPLEQGIRTGQRDNFHNTLTEDDWRRYLRGLGDMAKLTAKEVVRKIPFPKVDPATKQKIEILDVAGGHGVFSATFCEKYPSAQATILDLPQGVAQGSSIVTEMFPPEVVARVRFMAGDLKKLPWPDDNQIVLLFNILHNLNKEDAIKAVKDAFAALKSGGHVVILEGAQKGGTGNYDNSGGFGRLLFYLLSDSETWPEEMMRTWLIEAGFVDVDRKSLLTLPGAVLLLARKP